MLERGRGGYRDVVDGRGRRYAGYMGGGGEAGEKRKERAGNPITFFDLMNFCAKFRPFSSPQVLEVWQTLAEIFACSADIL